MTTKEGNAPNQARMHHKTHHRWLSAFILCAQASFGRPSRLRWPLQRSGGHEVTSSCTSALPMGQALQQRLMRDSGETPLSATHDPTDAPVPLLICRWLTLGRLGPCAALTARRMSTPTSDGRLMAAPTCATSASSPPLRHRTTCATQAQTGGDMMHRSAPSCAGAGWTLLWHRATW